MNVLIVFDDLHQTTRVNRTQGFLDSNTRILQLLLFKSPSEDVPVQFFPIPYEIYVTKKNLKLKFSRIYLLFIYSDGNSKGGEYGRA